jgi:hypothetical protein
MQLTKNKYSYVLPFLVLGMSQFAVAGSLTKQQMQQFDQSCAQIVAQVAQQQADQTLTQEQAVQTVQACAQQAQQTAEQIDLQIQQGQFTGKELKKAKKASLALKEVRHDLMAHADRHAAEMRQDIHTLGHKLHMKLRKFGYKMYRVGRFMKDGVEIVGLGIATGTVYVFEGIEKGTVKVVAYSLAVTKVAAKHAWHKFINIPGRIHHLFRHVEVEADKYKACMNESSSESDSDCETACATTIILEKGSCGKETAQSTAQTSAQSCEQAQTQAQSSEQVQTQAQAAQAQAAPAAQTTGCDDSSSYEEPSDNQDLSENN